MSNSIASKLSPPSFLSHELASQNDLTTVHPYPLGFNLSKCGLGPIIKSDSECFDAFSTISSNLNHFNSSFSSTRPLLFPEVVTSYVPHRKRRENKPRRQRTTFSSEQTLKLEMEYRRAEYVTRTRRLELADDLNLTETQIKIWYQNRRAKDKRIEKAHLDQHIRAMGLNNMSTSVPYPGISPSLPTIYGWDPWMLRTQMNTAMSKVNVS